MNRIQAWDSKILLFLNQFFAKHGLGFLDKFLAEYLTYCLPLILIVLWFWPVSPTASRGGSKDAKKVALRALFSAILAWPIFSLIIGKLVDRPRPFDVSGVQELIFHRPTYSFPSDHAAALFAVAMSFYFSGYKKMAILMLAIALVVSFFRVATGLHFPTDILAGAAIGIFAAYLIYLFDRPLDIIYNLISKVMTKLRLV